MKTMIAGVALAMILCAAAQAQLTECWSPVGRLPTMHQTFVGRVPAGQMGVGRVPVRPEGLVAALPDLEFGYVGRRIAIGNLVGRMPDDHLTVSVQFRDCEEGW